MTERSENVMEHDPLTNLLQRADAEASPPPSAVDVALRVRRCRTRRRRVRTGGALLATLLVVGVTVQVGRKSASPDRSEATGVALVLPEKPVDATATRGELALLSQERRVSEAVVQRLLETERQRLAPANRPAPVPQVDFILELQWQREQAAAVLVRQGDRLANELNLPAAAQVAYQQASSTFPNTRSGAIAYERLTQNQ